MHSIVKIKNPHILTLAIILLLALDSSGFNTTTEDVNPFNKLLHSGSDINYSTGTVSFINNLFTMSGRNGMDFNVALRYSSNVFTRVKARNDISPTTWVGLGWSFSVGSISCNNKKTANLEDDEYYYTSTDGYSSRIITKIEGSEIKYYIEKLPYISIECFKDTDPNVITGWILTDENGIKYYFGDLDFDMTEYPSNRNATRYSLRVNNSVNCWYNNGSESGNKVVPTYYPYQWDIFIKEDRFGNRIKFEYDQQFESIKFENTPYYYIYTKASYLKKVTNPQGAYIEFTLSEKVVGDNIDPFLGSDRGVEVKYESKKLDKITCFNASKDKIKTFDFEYDYLNINFLGDDYAKLILRKIREKDFKNAAGKVINVNEYSYLSDYNKEGEQFYNYGALYRRKNYLGVSRGYSYHKQELPTANASAQFPVSAQGADAHVSIVSGYKTGGYPFYVATSVDQIVIFNWTGHSWEIEKVEPNALNATMSGIPIIVSTGRDFFVAVGGQPPVVGGPRYRGSQSIVHLFIWDGLKWERRDISRVGSLQEKSYKVVKTGPEYVSIIEARTGDRGSGAFVILNKKDNFSFSHNEFPLLTFWDEEEAYPDPEKPMPDIYNKIFSSNNYIAVNVYSDPPEDDKKIWFYTWDGSSWIKTIMEENEGPEAVHFTNVFGGEYYCVGYEININSSWGVKYYNFDGNSWKLARYIKRPFVLTPYHYYMYGTYHTVSEFPYNNNLVKGEVNRWTGFTWKKYIQDDESGNYYFFGNDDYWIKVTKAFSGSPPHGRIRKSFSWKYDSSINDYQFEQIAFPSGIKFNGLSWILAEKTFYVTFQPGIISPDQSSAVVWDGQYWNLNDWAAYGLSYPIGVKSATSTANSFGIVDHQNVAGVYYKLGDRFAKNFYTYVVGSKNDVSAYAISKSWRLNFMDGIYDVENGTAKFNYAFELPPNHAPIARYFYNDTKADNQHLLNADYKDLDGKLYKKELYDAFENLMYTSFSNEVKVNRNKMWPHEVNTVRTLKKNTTLDNVTREVKTDFNGAYDDNHEDINGLPVLQQTKNSIGSLARFTQFAYETYPDLKTEHMLSPVTKRVLFKGNVGEQATVVESEPVSVDVTQSPFTYTFILNSTDLQDVKNGDKLKIDFKVKTNSQNPDEQNLINRVKFDIEIEKNASPPDDKYLYSYINGAVVDNTFSRNTFDFTVDCIVDIEKFTAIKLIAAGYNMPLRIEDLQCTVIEGWELPDDILSSDVTTWKSWDFGSKQVWAPYETFVWKEPMDANGNPENPYFDFDFSDPEASVSSGKWLFTGGISKYNTWGQVIEQKMPYQSYPTSVTINALFYRSDFSAPIASARAAYFNECAFFPCDYNQNIENNSIYYFDLENSWKQGEKFADGILEVNTSKPHFGHKSLRVKNSFGPTKRITRIDPNKDYIFSAWVFVNSGKPRFVVEAHVDNSGTPSGSNYDDFVTGTTGWTLIKRVVTSARLTAWGIDGTDDYLKIWIGNYSSDGADMAEFYIDDIRFYPNDALVSTTYYDSFWQLPIVTIDANNNPSPRLTYDEHGRLDKAQYIKYKENYTGADTLFLQREYHLVGQME